MVRGVSEVEILASTSAGMLRNHDRRDYATIRKLSKLNLKTLNVPKGRIEEASGLMSSMYEIADEAETYLHAGDKDLHDKVFAKVFALGETLNSLVGVRSGAIRNEMRWWYHYRMSYAKNSKIINLFHFMLAMAFLTVDHLKRISLPGALLCAIWLIKVGERHYRREWLEVEKLLRHYWSAKIVGNRGRIEPKLILV